MEKKNINFLYMDIDSPIPLTKADDFYKLLSVILKKWLDTSNYDTRRRKRPLPKEKNKIGMMKDEKGVKIITKSATTAPKAYGNIVQKDDHEIEDSEFIKAKEVKSSPASLAK